LERFWCDLHQNGAPKKTFWCIVVFCFLNNYQEKFLASLEAGNVRQLMMHFALWKKASCGKRLGIPIAQAGAKWCKKCDTPRFHGLG